jgi:hypothetical protein
MIVHVKDVPSHLIPAGFTGREVRIEQLRLPFRFSGRYWDGGSRNRYWVKDIATGQSVAIAGVNPLTHDPNEDMVTDLPPNTCIVQLVEGNRERLYIYGNLAPLLPAQEELSENEKIVLKATRTYKSSYAGIKNYRYDQVKHLITLSDWVATQQLLQEKGYLDKRNALTIKGKNAC